MLVRHLFMLTVMGGAALGGSVPAWAGLVDLTFEGVYPINTVFPIANYAAIQDFYNGGTSSLGTSGVNYGITFNNALAVCLNTPGTNCGTGFSRGGMGDPNSQHTGLIVQNGSSAILNADRGLTTGISFTYSTTNDAVAPQIEIYSGQNGTGLLLAAATLPVNQSGGCSATYYSAPSCPFGSGSFSFYGIAKSVKFIETGGKTVFDDITLTTSAIPEPAALAVVGVGLAGLGLIRLQRRR